MSRLTGGPPPPAKLRRRCGQIRPSLGKGMCGICFNCSVESERLGLHGYRAVWISSPVKANLAAGSGTAELCHPMRSADQNISQMLIESIILTVTRNPNC